MESGNQLGEFLRAKRELLSPEDVGLPSTGRRRAQGLRREEAALLAGISPDYYLRLEQGDDQNPSDQVLDGIAKALNLDDDAAAYLHQLAHPSSGRRREANAPEQVSASLAGLISAWPAQAAYIQGRLMDVLAANPLAIALSPSFTPGTNGVRAAFLDPAVRDLYSDWDGMIAQTVAGLRALIGPNVDDPQLAQIIGELSVRSEEFRRLWAQQEVRVRRTGTVQLHHPQVGSLELDCERLAIAGSDGQVLVIFHATAATPSEAAFRRLAAIASGEETPDSTVEPIDHDTPADDSERVLPAPVPIDSKRRAP